MSQALEAIDDAARHGIGGNKPPVFVELSELAAPLIETANRWLTERPEITDEEMAEKAVAFKGQLDALLKRSEAARVEEKKPHDEAAAAVQRKWRGLMTPAEACIDLLKPRLAAYLNRKEAERRKAEADARAEADRLLQEAAEKQRKAEEIAAQATSGDLIGSGVDVVGAQIEAQESVAAAKVAEKAARAIETAPSNVRGAGGYGRTAALKSTWDAEITDYGKALKHFKDHPAVKEAVLSIAKSLARSPATRGMTIPGVDFVERKTL